MILHTACLNKNDWLPLYDAISSGMWGGRRWRQLAACPCPLCHAADPTAPCDFPTGASAQQDANLCICLLLPPCPSSSCWAPYFRKRHTNPSITWKQPRALSFPLPPSYCPPLSPLSKPSIPIALTSHKPSLQCFLIDNSKRLVHQTSTGQAPNAARIIPHTHAQWSKKKSCLSNNHPPPYPHYETQTP